MRLSLTLASLVALGTMAAGQAAAQDGQPPTPSTARAPLFTTSQALFDPLSRSATSLADSSCSYMCETRALVLPASETAGTGDYCLANVQLQAFTLAGGATRTGALTGVAVQAARRDAGSVSRPFRVFFSLEGGEAGSFVRSLCTPRELRVENKVFVITDEPVALDHIASRPLYADLAAGSGNASASTGSIAGIGGMLHGITRSAKQRASAPSGFLTLLFGYSSSQVVELDIRSIPAGAELMVDGKATGLTTDSLVALAVRSLPSVVVRLGKREMPLKACQGAPGGKGMGAAFVCDLTPRR